MNSKFSRSNANFSSKEVPLGSDFALKAHNAFSGTLLTHSNAIFEDWQLGKIVSIDNPLFENQFVEKREQFQRDSYSQDALACNYGFLATVNDTMIDIVLEEGLVIKLCPINILGHSIAGVHLSVHGDVCLREAASEMTDTDCIILVMFKFMYGRRRPVAPSDGDVLLAPTPFYDSHVSMVQPTPTDILPLQHKTSLVYLYEFENSLFHPVTRPRHCCPVAALFFRPIRRRQNLTGSMIADAYLMANQQFQQQQQQQEQQQLLAQQDEIRQRMMAFAMTNPMMSGGAANSFNAGPNFLGFGGGNQNMGNSMMQMPSAGFDSGPGMGGPPGFNQNFNPNFGPNMGPGNAQSMMQQGRGGLGGPVKNPRRFQSDSRPYRPGSDSDIRNRLGPSMSSQSDGVNSGSRRLGMPNSGIGHGGASAPTRPRRGR